MNKEQIKKINFVWEWEREAFPYYCFIFLTQWKNNLFSPSVHGYIINRKGNADCYLDKDMLEKSAIAILNKVKKDGNFLKKWKKHVFKSGKELNLFCEKIKKLDLTELKNKEILEIYKKSTYIYLRHTDGVGVIRNSNRALAQELESFVNSKIKNEKERKKYLADLFLTSEKSFTAVADVDLLNLILRIKKRGELTKKNLSLKSLKLLKDYYEKHLWLNVGYNNMRALDKKKFLENFFEMARISDYNLKKELKKFYLQPFQIKKIIRKALEKIKPSRDIKRVIKFAGTCTFFKDFIRGNLNNLHYTNQLIFSEIGRRLKMSWQEAASFTPPEMEKILQGHNNFKLSNQKDLFIYANNKKVNIILGSKAVELANIVVNLGKHSDIEIKGTVVYPGIVRGKVLVIKKEEDFDNKKITGGFVLVTPMTTPDIIFLIKKSSAVITDEGGLTCHAAIVSRELNKPCIVGAKIATKILKNGDLVEVNAQKGIVKILKK